MIRCPRTEELMYFVHFWIVLEMPKIASIVPNVTPGGIPIFFSRAKFHAGALYWEVIILWLTFRIHAFEMYRNTIRNIYRNITKKERKTVGNNWRMNKMTEGNCRIGYTTSQAWILKVLQFYCNIHCAVSIETMPLGSQNEYQVTFSQFRWSRFWVLLFLVSKHRGRRPYSYWTQSLHLWPQAVTDLQFIWFENSDVCENIKWHQYAASIPYPV